MVHDKEEETTDQPVRKKGSRKHQSVIALDMESWEQLIELFDIKEPMIPHRDEELQQNAPGVKGWYT